MLPKVYSKSLKKIKKHQVFDYSIDKVRQMQLEIERSAQTIQIKEKPIKDYVLARKELIEHKHSKNKLQQQVDQIMKKLVQSNHLSLKNTKINQKHNYNHYRIETEPSQQNLRSKKRTVNFTHNHQEQEPGKTVLKNPNQSDSTPDNKKLPRIQKSASHSGFTHSKSRKLKTQQELIERLSDNPKNKILDYINIDSAIRQYRSGMTTLMKGVYYNPHNPYKK